MDKLKKLFSGGDKHESTTSASTSSAAAPGEVVENANSVVLHTTVGDITVKLFSDQTPKVGCMRHLITLKS